MVSDYNGTVCACPQKGLHSAAILVILLCPNPQGPTHLCDARKYHEERGAHDDDPVEYLRAYEAARLKVHQGSCDRCAD